MLFSSFCFASKTSSVFFDSKDVEILKLSYLKEADIFQEIIRKSINPKLTIKEWVSSLIDMSEKSEKIKRVVSGILPVGVGDTANADIVLENMFSTIVTNIVNNFKINFLSYFSLEVSEVLEALKELEEVDESRDFAKNIFLSLHPFAWPILNNDLNLVKAYVENGMYCNFKFDLTEGANKDKFLEIYFITPVGLAVISENKDIIEFFISEEVNINEPFLGSKAIFNLAIIFGSLDLIKYLLDNGADVNQLNFHLDSPLSLAIELENLKVVKLLLDNGAYINDELTHDSILSYALRCSSLEICNYLVDNGAVIYPNYMFLHDVKNDVDKNKFVRAGLKKQLGFTDLHLSVLLGDIEEIQKLLDANVDVNSFDFKGFTPLHMAVLYYDYVNRSPHMIGEYVVNYDIHVKYLKIIKMLLEFGANIYSKDNNGTPLKLAVELGHLKVIDYLLNYKK